MSPTRGDFAEVVRANYDRIYRGAVCLVGDADTARDLVQETFYLALRSYGSFDGRSSELIWLYRILLRVHGRMLRRELLRQRLGLQPCRPAADGRWEGESDPGRSALLCEEEQSCVRVSRKVTDALLSVLG